MIGADEIARTFEAFVDALIPGDVDFPAASVAGADGLAADRIRATLGQDGLIELATALNEGGSFLDARSDRRAAAIRQLAARQPAIFDLAQFATYFSYYQMPAVVLALQRLGHEYHDAPQPLGYRMDPFDPAHDAPTHARGFYKKTDDVARIDLSSLSDLDLPVKE